MKKYIFALAAIAALMVSCTKEVIPGQDGKFTIRVSKEAINETKAELSGTNVVFAAGDKVSVLNETANIQFTTTSGGATAAFTGPSLAEADSYIVLSPYDENATRVSATSMQVYITIPDVQVATPNGVDPKALISAGVVNKAGNVQLKNAVGLLKIIVPDGLTVSRIQVAGGKGVSIAVAGQFKFNADTGALDVVTGKTIPLISLVPAEGKDTIDPGTYYVAIRPKAYATNEGFIVSYVNAAHQLCKRTTLNAVTIQRNNVLSAGYLSEGDFTPVTGTAVLRAYGDYSAIWQFTGFIKKLAGGSGTGNADDNVVKKFVFQSATLIPNDKANDAASVSSSAGDTPIYAHLEDGVVYVYTEASKITLNSGCANLFRNFLALEEVVFDNVATVASTSFEYMFRSDTKLRKVDFGNADFSKVTNFSYMFYTGASSLEYVNLAETATTSATTMQSMFNNNQNLKYVYLGRNFTVAPTYLNMFLDAAKQTSIDSGGDPEKKCQLYLTTTLWESLKSVDGFNTARYNPHYLD